MLHDNCGFHPRRERPGFSPHLVTGRSKADLVRSIVFPALESLVAEKFVGYVNWDEYARIWQDMSQGKTSKDVAFEKKMLEEEEHFWTK